MPIIIGLDRGEREALVVLLQKPDAGKPRKLGEVDRSEHAIRVHIVDARMNIIRARAQMVERHGFHPIFFLRTADHGVESEAGVFLALDHPSLTMFGRDDLRLRSEEHTSELQSLMRISYAVLCLKKK